MKKKKKLIDNVQPGMVTFKPTLFRQSLGASLPDFLDNCASIQAICHSTDDHLEAVTSMLEKRDPTFKGK